MTLVSEKFKKRLAGLLPGIFMVGFTVGTGSVTSMSKAGGDYGMALLWLLLASSGISFAFYYLSTKFAVVTGKPMLFAMRESWGAPLPFALVGILGLHFAVVTSAVLNIMVACTNLWLSGLGLSLPEPVLAFLFLAPVYLCFLKGRFPVFEKAMAVIVTVMITCFALVVFLAPPSAAGTIAGFAPSIPQTTGQGLPVNPFVLLAGMIGTTLAMAMVIARTSQALDKGWTTNDLPYIRKDILSAVFLIFVIHALMMAAAAGTVFRDGGTINSIEEMIVIFSKLGRLAPFCFLGGLIAAGMSSLLPAFMMPCWLKNNLMNSREPMSTAKHRIVVTLYYIVAFFLAIQDIKPVPLMIVSQITGLVLLPLITLFLFHAYNRKTVMGVYAARWRTNTVFVLILLFASFMSVKTALGLKGYIQKNFQTAATAPTLTPPPVPN